MRIVLADDQPRLRFALRVLLQQQPNLRFVAEVADAGDLMAQLKSGCPDLVLLDWELPDLAALGGIARLRDLCPWSAVIALGGGNDAQHAALAAGADAFVSKSDPPERLLAAIAIARAAVCRAENPPDPRGDRRHDAVRKEERHVVTKRRIAPTYRAGANRRLLAT